ncbi:MAG: hypothetical protein RMJ98_01860, partial [Myxococcales bacterium]|nr:hypothetical protein [Myxococcales bacterium]
MVPTRPHLGQLLVEAGLISPEQLAAALQVQQRDRRRLGTLLVEAGILSEVQLTQVLSQQLNAPWVSLYHIDFSRHLLNLVPREIAERFCLIPIYVRNVRGQGNTLYVAMDDPTNKQALEACASAARLPVRAMIAPPSDIRNALRIYYGVGSVPEVRSALGSLPEIDAELLGEEDELPEGSHQELREMGKVSPPRPREGFLASIEIKVEPTPPSSLANSPRPPTPGNRPLSVPPPPPVSRPPGPLSKPPPPPPVSAPPSSLGPPPPHLAPLPPAEGNSSAS